MNWPNCIKDNKWRWIIGTIIATITAIVVPLILTKSTNPPTNIKQTLNTDGDKNVSTQISNSPGTTISINNLDNERLAREKASFQNTDK